MSDRKRSRWGAPKEKAASSTEASAASVSDQDALQALLAEAQEKQQRKQREERQQHDSKQRPPSHKRPRRPEPNKNEQDNYYGPAGAATSDDQEQDEAPSVEKQKPDFGVSGALAKDTTTGGNVYKGVLLKFREPPEARAPNTQWRLYVFKGDDQIDTLHISKQSAYLIGRNTDICDIPIQHASCSSQHAVLQYRALPKEGRLLCQPYLMDLESTNGSFINGVRIEAARYYQLKKGDVIRFGASTREYVLMAPT